MRPSPSTRSMTAVFAVLLLTACAPPGRHQDIRVGGVIPSFSLPSLDGGTFESSNLEGQVVILNFWATWCGPCVREIPTLKSFSGNDSVAVVSIALDDEGTRVVRPFVERYGIDYPVLMGDGALFDRFNGYAIPYTLVLDPALRIVNIHRGLVTKRRLEKDVQQALSQGQQALKTEAQGAAALGAGVQSTDGAPPGIPLELQQISVLDGGTPVRLSESLSLRAGLHLDTDHADFGGFSGLHIDCPTRRLTAISDRGHWWQATLDLSDDGTLRAVESSRLSDLLDHDGDPVSGRSRRDAEELVRIDGGWLVTFEGDHRMAFHPALALDPPKGLPQAFPAPDNVQKAPTNGGLEAATLLEETRRLLLLTEDQTTDDDLLAGWISSPIHPDQPTSVAWEAFGFVPTAGFQPTAAAPLPGDGALVLERYFDRQAKINHVRLSHLRPDDISGASSPVRSEELGILQPPLPMDNFEGIATCPVDGDLGASSPVAIYMVSDDNFNEEQRTLLLQLELKPLN